MDSPGFPLLVQNFTDLSGEDYSHLKKLSDKYPYSQLLHLMLARAAHDLSDADEEKILHQSAVYSTDRQVLKWVMTTPKKETVTAPKKEVVETVARPAPVKLPASKSEPIAKPVATPVVMQPEAMVSQSEAVAIVRPIPKKSELKVEAVQFDNPLSGDALRDDLYAELEKLQKLKHDFEISFDEFQSAHHNEATGPSESVPIEKEPVEPLIEEIKASRKKIKTDNPKQKEQGEIIDQFIKTKPAIPRAKPMAAAQDLSEDSGIFSDNVVSETLVDILLKQGKKDKAVEVLKKLIWKFPQKKAYFAAQIDKLKS